MDKLFYLLFIKLYAPFAKLISGFNNKAGLWIEGRKNIFAKIEEKLHGNTAPVIWMHCASLGEFEQGKPVLEEIKSTYNNYKILLTFFSPSGYEAQKNTNSADFVFYLPIDSAANAKKFLQLVKPSLILFVKYEFWFFYLKEANKRNIPLLLISGIFLPHYSFFKWYGKMRREMLKFFSHLFVQTEQSLQMLKSININNVSVTGDTRFDRVLEVAAQQKTFPEIERFINYKKTIIAGSTWTDDDEELDHFANTQTNLRFIIAPHEINKERLEECKSLYRNSILFSEYVSLFEAQKSLPDNINTLIIDNIGTLKFLYKYATVCYVGGGFGDDGIHNILEAAVYYKPVVFGPKFENFSEAISLIESGGAYDVENALELEDIFQQLLSDNNFYTEACKKTGDYVQQNAGATKKIMQYIQEKRLLIS